MMNKILSLLFVIAHFVNANSQSIKVNDTDFSKGRLGFVQEIDLEDLVKFHGHQCDGLVEGFRALQEALFYLYPDGVVDRTNTRIISQSAPCLADAAIYLTGGRYQYNRFYIDEKLDGLYYVERIDNGNAVYVKRKDGIKPKIIDSLNTLAVKGVLTPCALKSLQLYENDYARQLLAVNTWDLFDLYAPTKKTKISWKPNKKNDYIKTDIINKNAGQCDINDGANKTLFLSLSPQQFNDAMNNPGNVVLDVRTPDELKETGLIRMANNVDFQNPNFEKIIDTFDKNKTYFVYCRSGKRSFGAMEIMKMKGFKKLVMLDGGILQWTEQNLPLFKF